MSKKIKASELWAAVQEIATEQPDHIYEQPGLHCVYRSMVALRASWVTR